MTHPGRRRSASQDEQVMLSDLIKNVKRTQQATLRSMIEMEILKGNIIAFEIHETFELVNGSHRNVVHDMVIKKTRTFQIWLDETMTRFASRQSRYYRPTAQMVSVGLADERVALQHTQDAIRRRRRSLPDNLQQAPHSEQEHLLEESGLQKGGRPPITISTPTAPSGGRVARVTGTGGDRRAPRPQAPQQTSQTTTVNSSGAQTISGSAPTDSTQNGSIQTPGTSLEPQQNTHVITSQAESGAITAPQNQADESPQADAREQTPATQGSGAESEITPNPLTENAPTDVLPAATEKSQSELPTDPQATTVSETVSAEAETEDQPATLDTLSIPTEQSDILSEEVLETSSPEDTSQNRSELNRSLLDLAGDAEDGFELFNPDEQDGLDTPPTPKVSDANSAPRTLDELDADQNLFAWSDQ